jgi:valyl-tRNA synthetase
VDCIINTRDEQLAGFLRAHESLAKDLARVSGFRFDAARPPQSSIAVLSGLEAYVPLGGVVDVEKEIGRIAAEAANLAKLIAGIDAKFANPNFAARAKPEVVEGERVRRAEFASKQERLSRQLEGWK